MRWFCGMNIGEKLSVENLKKEYEEYYNQIFHGVCFENNDFINYVALENGENGEFIQFHKNVLIVGDFSDIYFTESAKDEDKTLAELYLADGIDFLRKLAGRFAFALFDFNNNLTYLVRDQFGMGQMFYFFNEGRLVFSNFLYSLRGNYNPQVVSEKYLYKYYLNNGMLDFSDTPYPEIKRVNVASYVKIKDGRKIEKEYWNITYCDLDCTNYDYNEWKECIRQKLIYSLTNRLKKCRQSLLLSGGLDSNVLFYFMYYLGLDYETYSAVFDVLTSCDEREYIGQMREKFQDRNFNYINLDDAGIFRNFPDSFFYTSEPHINIINKDFSEPLFSAIRNDKIKYVVDGFFADHLFTGNVLYTIDELKKGKIIESFRNIYEYAIGSNETIWDVFCQEIIPAVRKKKIKDISSLLLKENKRYLERIDYYNNMDLLIQVRCSIARNFGDYELAPRYDVECIHPYVDTELASLMYQIPGKYKWMKGIPKFILRDIVSGKIPEAIVERVVKTQHVEVSLHGLSQNWANIYSILSVGRICELNVFAITKTEWINKLNDFRSGKLVDDYIWIMISIEIWLYQIEAKYGKIVFAE